MAKKKILYELDDDYFNFSLVAIKSSIIEDYLFIYQLNDILKTHFTRAEQDLSIFINNHEFHFSIYQYQDSYNHINYTIFSNISQEKTLSETLTLFGKDTTRIPMFNSLKFYNYLLKTETDFSTEISLDLQNISHITHYQKVNAKTLKNNDYLILP